MEKEEYEKLLSENVTKTYTKTTEQKLKTINKNPRKITTRQSDLKKCRNVKVTSH